MKRKSAWANLHKQMRDDKPHPVWQTVLAWIIVLAALFIFLRELFS